MTVCVYNWSDHTQCVGFIKMFTITHSTRYLIAPRAITQPRPQCGQVQRSHRAHSAKKRTHSLDMLPTHRFFAGLAGRRCTWKPRPLWRNTSIWMALSQPCPNWYWCRCIVSNQLSNQARRNIGWMDDVCNCKVPTQTAPHRLGIIVDFEPGGSSAKCTATPRGLCTLHRIK